MGAYANRPAAFSEAQIRCCAPATTPRPPSPIASRRPSWRSRWRRSGPCRSWPRRSPPSATRRAAAAGRGRRPAPAGLDGAHLTLRDPDAPILRPHVIAGGVDEVTREWLSLQEFPIGGGMNGLAAEQARRSGPTTTWSTRAFRTPRTTRRWPVGWGCAAHGRPIARARGEIFGTLATWEHRARRPGRARAAAEPGRHRGHRHRQCPAVRADDRVRPALSVPGRQLAGPDLDRRPRRSVHLPVGDAAQPGRLGAGGSDRAPLRRDRGARVAAERAGALGASTSRISHSSTG